MRAQKNSHLLFPRAGGKTITGGRVAVTLFAAAGFLLSGGAVFAADGDLIGTVNGGTSQTLSNVNTAYNGSGNVIVVTSVAGTGTAFGANIDGDNRSGGTATGNITFGSSTTPFTSNIFGTAGNVMGGRATNNGSANGSIVTIWGAGAGNQFGAINGGYAYIPAGDTSSGSAVYANGNRVEIHNTGNASVNGTGWGYWR